MTAAIPSERVVDILVNSGYRRVSAPLQIAGLTFDVAAALVGIGHSADLVVVGDMAADGERKVLQQIEGIARALDVVRSHRPLTIVIVGPRPVGKTLEALVHVGRILPVEEAVDSTDLRDRIAILLPLKLPATLMEDRDLGASEGLSLPDSPLAADLLEVSKLGEEAVKNLFHTALNAIFTLQAEAAESMPK